MVLRNIKITNELFCLERDYFLDKYLLQLTLNHTDLEPLIKANETTFLELLEEKHAEAILHLVKNNREHLKEWLTWVDNMQTVEDFKKFIKESNKRYAAGQELSFVIVANDQVVGRVGIYNVDQYNKHGSIGYWIGKEHEGKGIITAACKALIKYCFSYINLNRIEIKCGTENFRSQAIPEKLGFIREGKIRQAEFVNNKFIDLFLFSMLKEEWKG